MVETKSATSGDTTGSVTKPVISNLIQRIQ